MINSRSILAASFALCLASCTGIPFFSSEATPRNPVPKPDWEQNHDGAEPKSKQRADSERKRTPSVVWLPESQVRTPAFASNQNRVIDSTGHPVLTALSDCVRPGYSLLDGSDCEADSNNLTEGDATKSIVSNDGNELSELNTDLLGRTPEAIKEKALPPAPKIVDSSPSNEGSQEDLPVGELLRDPIDTPKIIPAVAKPAPAGLMPARYERIVLSSDLVFDFAKFSLEGLSAAGQEALRGLRERFAKYDPTSFRKVVITGHADRLGKPKSNVAISQKRASAVKSFLISTGIDPDILEAVGVGSVSPVAHCTGKRKSAKLKSCLAPNRRVEIQIIGAT